MFFKTELISEYQFQAIDAYFNYDDGLFPEEELLNYLYEQNLIRPSIGYIIAKYAVYRGVEIASKSNFFQNFQKELRGLWGWQDSIDDTMTPDES